MWSFLRCSRLSCHWCSTSLRPHWSGLYNGLTISSLLTFDSHPPSISCSILLSTTLKHAQYLEPKKLSTIGFIDVEKKHWLFVSHIYIHFILSVVLAKLTDSHDIISLFPSTYLSITIVFVWGTNCDFSISHIIARLRVYLKDRSGFGRSSMRPLDGQLVHSNIHLHILNPTLELYFYAII